MPEEPWKKYAGVSGPWNKYGSATPASPAGTLQYKQDTAAMQFEANKPIPTAATGLQNLGESILETFHKPDPVGDMSLEGIRKAGSLQPGLIDMVKGAYHGIVDPVVNYGSSLLNRDPDAAARAGGKILTQTVPAVAAVPEALRTGLKAATTPESMLSKAAVNRGPLPKLTTADVARDALTTGVASGAGMAVGGPAGAAAAGGIAEGANLLRRTNLYRGAKASLQERVAKFISDKPAPFTAVADMPAPSGPIERPLPPIVQNQAQRRASITVPTSATTPEPIAVSRPTTPTFIQNQLEATRAAETPEQLYQRQVAQREAADYSKTPLTESPKIGIPRLQPPEIPAAAPHNLLEDVERGIAPSGARAKLSTLRVAPKLQDVAPEIRDVRPGPLFDAGLNKAFKRVEGEVITAEDAIPRTTTVPKEPIVKGMTDLAADYRSRGLEQIAGKIEGEAAKWTDLPSDIPWEEFLKRKRGFFQGSGAQSAPMRRAYGVLMDSSAGASESLSKANRSYSIVRQALEAGKIDPITGRRIMNVGKPK